jgi:DGQHR domain-containing protein
MKFLPKAAKKKRKSAKKLSTAEQKQRADQRRFRLSINTLFKNCGFSQIATRDKQIEFKGQKGDLDAIFYFENIIVISEDTISLETKDHINKTGLFYAHLKKHAREFLESLCQEYEKLRDSIFTQYELDEIEIRFIYCSRHPIEARHLENHPCLIGFPNASIKYFLALSRTIHRSGCFELLKFLSVPLDSLRGSKAGIGGVSYPAFVLPETPSGFPDGHKVVSFYIDPESLIERAYVLRKDSWMDGDSLYQRMLIRGKIRNMREYLAKSKRVYINNIVASLPPNASFKDTRGKEVMLTDIKKPGQFQVILPTEFDCVGIIDGQHRVFSYYEGVDQFEDEIAKRRKKQQLLVTGIIFPEEMAAERRAEFEARLFLEINDKQSRAKADLKQAIETIISPFTPVALAKSVISQLATTGPLAGYLEEHFFGDGTIKTSSIVSYGLRHLVEINPKNTGSLFNLWQQAGKESMISKKDLHLRKYYIKFCVSELNKLLSGFKANVPTDKWTPKRADSRALSTTTINGLIFCMRKVVESDSLLEFDGYRLCFSRMTLDFTPKKFAFKSSHWRALGDKLYDQCFA